jgi:Protein of unknown function (DUF2796)
MNCPHEIKVLLMGLTLGMSCAVAPAAEKRHSEAHVHGVAEINIAVEGSKADIEFRSPAESVMGFEHEAKSESDKKKREAALRTLQNKMNQMVLFDPKLRCKFSEPKTTVVEEKEERSKEQSGKTGEHREVRATSSVRCDKPLAGSRVTFGVTKVFPEIYEVKVQVLSDTKQSGATIKKDQGDVRL